MPGSCLYHSHEALAAEVLVRHQTAQFPLSLPPCTRLPLVDLPSSLPSQGALPQPCPPSYATHPVQFGERAFFFYIGCLIPFDV